MRNTIASILVFALGCATVTAQSTRKELLELADAERAFSAYTVKAGFRDGFIKYFADDGIGFGPHPERTKAVLLKQPVQTGPRTLIFEWAPMFGDISSAGDLGYTTGPVLFTPQGTDAKPPWHGIYFSVWEKEADGSWKVVIDMGVDTPKPVAPIDTGFTAAKPGGSAKKGTSAEAFDTLDKYFSESIAETNPLEAYRSRLDDQFRIHRKGMLPILDRANLEEIRTWPAKFEFMGGKIAKSNDLAFTYGKSTSVDAKAGYYVHVWRRGRSGKWRLVADVQSDLGDK